MWTRWGEGGGMNWEMGTDMNTLPCVKQRVGTCCIMQGAQLALCDDRDGWGMGRREGGTRGNIGILEAGSLCCTAETNTTL